MQGDRWEHGSDFHVWPQRGTPRWPWRDAVFFTSGRDALRQLVALVRPRKVWLPDYYCADVAPVLAAPVSYYADDPRYSFAPVTAAPGDMWVRCNTWGLRTQPVDDQPAPGVTLVEDHTHDPFSAWAFSSRADYAFASLRKTLPIADGASIWSPVERRLPPPLKPANRDDRWRAMELKAAYLAGEAVDKAAFRALFLASEEAVARDLDRGASDRSVEQVATFPTDTWHAARRNNFAALATLPGVLGPAVGATPFAATLELASAEQRDDLKRALVAQRIYPAVLWPIAHPLAARVLSVHCDGRYSATDMARVAAALERR